MILRTVLAILLAASVSFLLPLWRQESIPPDSIVAVFQPIFSFVDQFVFGFLVFPFAVLFLLIVGKSISPNKFFDVGFLKGLLICALVPAALSLGILWSR